MSEMKWVFQGHVDLPDEYYSLIPEEIKEFITIKAFYPHDENDSWSKEEVAIKISYHNKRDIFNTTFICTDMNKNQFDKALKCGIEVLMEAIYKCQK